MSNLPQWVIRDLRRQELEMRLRAAADSIPAHSFHAAAGGDYCVSCGLPQVHPIHDIRDVTDAWTADEMQPTAVPVNELETSGEFDGTMMIALWPDPDQAKRLAISGGEKAKNLHITLAFFPTSDGADKLREVLGDIAPYLSPLKGEVSGVGMFTSAQRDGSVTYASADIPGLPEFRQIIVDSARAVGVLPSDDHGFTPHMTLAYGDRRDHNPPNEPLAFDEVVLSVGGKEKYTFKLGSPEQAKKTEGGKVGKHMYSHPNFLRGSGLPDKLSPPCMVCGEGALDDVHEKPEHAAISTPVDAAKTMQGIDAGIDQALVLLRSCREDQMPEYALQARDLLQAVEEACDNMLDFFGVPDADEGDQDVKQEQADGPLSAGPVDSALPHVTPEGPQGQPSGTLIQPVLGQPDGTLLQKVLGQPPSNGTTQAVITEMARYYSPDQREEMARNGQAMPDGSFPIKDGVDLHAAITLVGHGGEAAKQHIIKRANDLGLEDQLPASWSTQKAFVTEFNGRTLLTGPADTFATHWEKAATPNKQILWMQGRFVGGEVPNRNKAFWSSGDLEFGAPTVTYGPLNWLHEARHIVGCIADQRLVTPNDYEQAAYQAQPHIAALAGVWTWIYPDEAWVIENASDQGKLWYSMECISENVECTGDTGCGEKASYRDYMAGKCCAHMRERSGVRRFENPTFLGGAVIVPPVRPGWAEADARVVREAAAMAEKAYDQAGRPDMPASDFEMLCGQVVQYALD